MSDPSASRPRRPRPSCAAGRVFWKTSRILIAAASPSGPSSSVLRRWSWVGGAAAEGSRLEIISRSARGCSRHPDVPDSSTDDRPSCRRLFQRHAGARGAGLERWRSVAAPPVTGGTNWTNFFTPYRIEIVRGNVVTTEQLARVSEGMARNPGARHRRRCSPTCSMPSAGTTSSCPRRHAAEPSWRDGVLRRRQGRTHRVVGPPDRRRVHRVDQSVARHAGGPGARALTPEQIRVCRCRRRRPTVAASAPDGPGGRPPAARAEPDEHGRRPRVDSARRCRRVGPHGADADRGGRGGDCARRRVRRGGSPAIGEDAAFLGRPSGVAITSDLRAGGLAAAPRC